MPEVHSFKEYAYMEVTIGAAPETDEELVERLTVAAAWRELMRLPHPSVTREELSLAQSNHEKMDR